MLKIVKVYCLVLHIFGADFIINHTYGHFGTFSILVKFCTK